MNTLKKEKVLYYFTDTYPFGRGLIWKFNELDVLRNYFDKIIVVPYHYGDNRQQHVVPEKVIVSEPLFESEHIRASLYGIFSRYFIYFYKEFFSSRVFLRIGWVRTWLVDCCKLKRLMSHDFIKNISLNTGDGEERYFYFFGVEKRAIFCH